ncbi:hypothetical protein BpHYR1_025625, partial [Brachionus plicatilis]
VRTFRSRKTANLLLDFNLDYVFALIILNQTTFSQGLIQYSIFWYWKFITLLENDLEVDRKLKWRHNFFMFYLETNSICKSCDPNRQILILQLKLIHI